MNARRLWAVIAKEVRQLRRDRLTLAMVVGVPVMQLVLFGYAINTNVRGLPAVIVDQAGTSASRAVVMDMVATGVVTPVAEATVPAQAMDALRRGEASVAIVVPPDLERRLAEGREAVQVMVDGSDNAVQSAAAQLARVPVAGSPGAAAVAPVQVVGFYNPGRRSAVSIVPGLIGVILTMTMVLFTAVAIVRERERGNMELLIATPLSRGELMLGKILPYIALGLVQATLVVLLGGWLFRVPVVGTVVDLYGAILLLVVASLALGLFISTRVRSQFQAMQGAFFVFLPSMLLSGFMFPFDGMPRAAQWLAEGLPLTHFMRLVRGVMLRGAGLPELWPDVLALVGFSAVMMAVAVAGFRKRLD